MPANRVIVFGIVCSLLFIVLGDHPILFILAILAAFAASFFF